MLGRQFEGKHWSFHNIQGSLVLVRSRFKAISCKSQVEKNFKSVFHKIYNSLTKANPISAGFFHKKCQYFIITF